MLERDLGLVSYVTELGSQQQDPPDGGDQPDKEERFRDHGMLAKGHLHGVEQLDDQKDGKDPVEKADRIDEEGSTAELLSEGDQPIDQKREGASRQQQAEADVDDVLNQTESASDPCPRRNCGAV